MYSLMRVASGYHVIIPIKNRNDRSLIDVVTRFNSKALHVTYENEVITKVVKVHGCRIQDDCFIINVKALKEEDTILDDPAICLIISPIKHHTELDVWSGFRLIYQGNKG